MSERWVVFELNDCVGCPNGEAALSGCDPHRPRKGSKVSIQFTLGSSQCNHIARLIGRNQDGAFQVRQQVVEALGVGT